ncbi:hypothetical protein Ciccas_012154 [Cichlidogyrus casuarinus]|uniref:Uncharacterized protein n=1 Tax=Cichlidogyrus casuarinus TaxID=1844966 RepID=A0ABD2PP69_9PLAT
MQIWPMYSEHGPPPIPKHRINNLTPRPEVTRYSKAAGRHKLPRRGLNSLQEQKLSDWFLHTADYPITSELSNIRPKQRVQEAPEWALTSDQFVWEDLVLAELISSGAIYCDAPTSQSMPQMDSEMSFFGGIANKLRLGRSMDNPTFEGSRSKSHHQFERTSTPPSRPDSPATEGRWPISERGSSPSLSIKAALNKQQNMGVVSAGNNADQLFAKFSNHGQKHIKSPMSVLAPCKGSFRLQLAKL